MKEDSPLANIYVGAVTTAIETLTELAQYDSSEKNEVVRFQAVSDLLAIANQIRNHDRLDQIIADHELAKWYFAGTRPLQS